MALGRITTIDRLKDPQGAIILCAYCDGEGKEPLRTELVDVQLRSEYSKSLPKVVEWHPINPCPICKGDLILKVVFEDSDSYLTTNNHCWGTAKDPSFWNQGIPRLCPKCSGIGLEASSGLRYPASRMSLHPLNGEEKLYKQRIGTVKNLLAQAGKLSAKPDTLKTLAQQLKLFIPNDFLLEANTDERLAYLMLYFTHDGFLNEDHEFLKHNKRAPLLYYLALFEKANELNCQNIFHKAGNSICFYISSPLSYKIRKEQFPTEDSQNTSEEIELLVATGNAIRASVTS